MNCRIVENSLFPNKTLADVLRKGFVEARLHTDMTPSMAVYAKYNARIKEVLAQYLGEGNWGLPHYFVFDPSDLNKPLAHRSGKASVQVFKDFFEAAQASRSGG